jgi:hypothetical protein
MLDHMIVELMNQEKVLRFLFDHVELNVFKYLENQCQHGLGRLGENYVSHSSPQILFKDPILKWITWAFVTPLVTLINLHICVYASYKLSWDRH